jgi:hypothetical protein
MSSGDTVAHLYLQLPGSLFIAFRDSQVCGADILGRLHTVLILKLKIIWMDAVVEKFNVLYWNLLGRTEEDHENRIYGLWAEIWNHGPPKCKAEVLLTLRLCSVSNGTAKEM